MRLQWLRLAKPWGKLLSLASTKRAWLHSRTRFPLGPLPTSSRNQCVFYFRPKVCRSKSPARTAPRTTRFRSNMPGSSSSANSAASQSRCHHPAMSLTTMTFSMISTAYQATAPVRWHSPHRVRLARRLAQGSQRRRRPRRSRAAPDHPLARSLESSSACSSDSAGSGF